MQNKNFKSLFILSVIVSLFLAITSNAQETLSFGSACINAYWPISGSQIPGADVVTCLGYLSGFT